MRLQRIIVFFIMTVLVGFVFPRVLIAEEQIGKITGDVVNVRTGPGTEYARKSVLTEGQTVFIINQQENWVQVDLKNNNNGWVAAWLVGSPNEKQERFNAVVNDTVVNVRQQPSISSSRVTQVTEGEKVKIINEKKDWYYVELSSGKEGWIAKWLLSIQGINANILQGKTIVIDPGHGSIQPGGWIDPGAVGKILGVKEIDVNLDTALRLQQLLLQQGAEVIMTHTGSTFQTLAGRADIANKHNADIFVSIHANFNNNTNYSGTAVYFYAPDWHQELAVQRMQRVGLAEALQDELVKAGGRIDLGVMEQSFAVLRETVIPSVLVELAFLSNSMEEKLLNTLEFREKMAVALYKGIEKYFSEL